MYQRKKEREALENRKHEIDMAKAKAPRANIGMAVFGNENGHNSVLYLEWPTYAGAEGIYQEYENTHAEALKGIYASNNNPG